MAEENAVQKAGSMCCGGPAPDDTDACCVQDAEVRAAGETGCGCGTPKAAAKNAAPASSCCS